MSVKVKTILLTAITLIIMGGGIFLLSRDYLTAHFASLESDLQRKDIEAVSKSIDRIYDEIGSFAVDWAVWDETDGYLEGDNPEFVAENFNPGIFSSLGIDLVILADKNGNTLYAAWFDQGSSTLHPINGEAVVIMAPDGYFGRLDQTSSHPEALITLDQKPFLVTARAVYPTSGEGPSSGVILFGRQVDGNMLDQIRVDTGIASIELFYPENAPASFKSIQPHLVEDEEVYMAGAGPERTIGFVLLYGPNAEIGGLLEIQLERTLAAQAEMAVNYLLGGMVLVAAIALLLNLLISNFLLFKPLEQLAQRVRQANNLEEQIQTLVDRPDELHGIGEPLETVLQLAQQAQKESIDRQTLYTRLFEQAREGFAILDPTTLQVMEANQEFARMLDWNREKDPEPSFHNLVSRWVDDDVAKKLSISEKEVAQGKVRLREQEVRLRGLNRDIEISISPIQAGENRYLYALLRDVSERIQLEETLKEQLRETTLLNQVIAVTTSDQEPTAVFETICRELSINLGLPQSVLALFDEQHTRLEVVAEYSKRSIPSSIGAVIKVAGIAELQEVLSVAEPLQVVINQTLPYPGDLQNLLSERGSLSALLIPLTVRELDHRLAGIRGLGQAPVYG